MKKVRFGVIGLGSIANKFCTDLVQSKSAKLEAVASRSTKKAEAFAEKYSCEKSYGDYLSLAQDKDIDIIYIAVPHVFHKKIAIMCMEAGKNVLCEKPAGVNEGELLEMIASAKKNDVFFMEGMWTRCFPISQKIKEIVSSGELGSIRYIDSSFGFGNWSDAKILDKNHRHFAMELAGGAILDVGVYCVAFTTWLKGKSPTDISTFARKTDSGVDGIYTSVYSYDDDCIATSQASICLDTSVGATVYFEKGKLEMECCWSPHMLKITDETGKEQLIEDDFAGRGYNGFIYEIDHVADCIKKGLKMSPYITWDNSIEIIRIMDTMRKQIDLVYPFE